MIASIRNELILSLVIHPWLNLKKFIPTQFFSWELTPNGCRRTGRYLSIIYVRNIRMLTKIRRRNIPEENDRNGWIIHLIQIGNLSMVLSVAYSVCCLILFYICIHFLPLSFIKERRLDNDSVAIYAASINKVRDVDDNIDRKQAAYLDNSSRRVDPVRKIRMSPAPTRHGVFIPPRLTHSAPVLRSLSVQSPGLYLNPHGATIHRSGKLTTQDFDLIANHYRPISMVL